MIEPPEIYSTHDPYDFCNSIATMDYYFDLYDFSDAQSAVR